MKVWKEGEKSQAYCEDCRSLVFTTFGIHDVEIAAHGILVDGIMAAACDHCGEVIAIPPQSTPSIKASMDAVTGNAAP